jgi:hypothetical protein
MAEIARYAPTDATCCPSAIIRVSYRVDRAAATPVVAAVETRRVR